MSNELPKYLSFDRAAYVWKPDIDYRSHPERYRVGKGEQGVLICEPYKSEIGINWKFRTEESAKLSSTKIFDQFLQYLKTGDFVGADMARKYLQMGYTRARRYANYKGGKKYDKENDFHSLPRGTGDAEKAKSAAVFYKCWKEAEDNPQYRMLKTGWKKAYG